MGNRTIEIFYLFFEGIMVFQVLFFGMIYLLSKRRDVLYYSLLNFVSAIYFFLNAPDTFLGIDENIIFNSPAYLYVNFALFLLMFFMYLVFLKEIFSDTLAQYAYVRKVYIITYYSIPSLYVLFVLFAMLGWNCNIIFYTGHLVNGPFCTLVLLLNFRQKGYKSLIIYGMMVIFICVVITIILTIRYNTGTYATILDKYPLAIIKMGMLIDILLFQLALLKRWNDQEKQLAVEKLQSQLDAEKLRNKISADLHDDIGSTISGISMHSYMAGTQLQEGNQERARESLQTIQQSAADVVNKLGDLVWSVKPGHDTLESMMEKLEQYGNEMSRAKNISFSLQVPATARHIKLAEEHRYHIYLLLKEAINNAVKYSAATHIKLETTFAQEVLKIDVDDNGKGFDTSIASKGNGLINMQQRATAIGAACLIRSAPGSGTSLSVQLKIPQ